MSTDINIFSRSDNIRLYVIEHTIHIEQLISELLASLLQIDLESSKSLGFGYGALSFNQKVSLVEDFKAIDVEMRNKLVRLMEIRNKFAHVQYIDNFERLFTEGESGKRIRKTLDKYDLSKKKPTDDIYKYQFFKLVEEITKLLFSLQINYRLNSLEKDTNKQIKDYQLDFLKDAVFNMNNGKNVIEDSLEKAIAKYKIQCEL